MWDKFVLANTMSRDARDRVPIEFFLNEYVSERMHRAITTNISPSGLYVHRLFSLGHRNLQLGREERYVQLEFTLPGISEVIWARGEIRHDEIGFGKTRIVGGPEAMVHGTGIHFVNIARSHARLVNDFVRERRIQRLQQILTLIRRNRYH